MRTNCCCDSLNYKASKLKKGSISSVARTQACSPPLLLLLLNTKTGGLSGTAFSGSVWTVSQNDGIPVQRAFSSGRPLIMTNLSG